MSLKHLKRLFPVDDSMVAILDDRGSVWQWCDNLIPVKPCMNMPYHPVRALARLTDDIASSYLTYMLFAGRQLFRGRRRH